MHVLKDDWHCCCLSRLTVRLLYNRGNAVFVIPALTTARSSALVKVESRAFLQLYRGRTDCIFYLPSTTARPGSVQ